MRAVLPPNSVIEPAARENMTLYAVGYIQLLTSKGLSNISLRTIHIDIVKLTHTSKCSSQHTPPQTQLYHHREQSPPSDGGIRVYILHPSPSTTHRSPQGRSGRQEGGCSGRSEIRGSGFESSDSSAGLPRTSKTFRSLFSLEVLFLPASSCPLHSQKHSLLKALTLITRCPRPAHMITHLQAIQSCTHSHHRYHIV